MTNTIDPISYNAEQIVTDDMIRAGRQASRSHGAGAMREIYLAMSRAAPADAERLALADKILDAAHGVVAANPEKASQWHDRPAVIGWFVGQVMRAMNGEADQEQVHIAVLSSLRAGGWREDMENAPVEDLGWLICEAAQGGGKGKCDPSNCVCHGEAERLTAVFRKHGLTLSASPLPSAPKNTDKEG